MKYKLISVFIIGLLALGLYAEAAADDGDWPENIAGTGETDGDVTGTDAMAWPENVVETGDGAGAADMPAGPDGRGQEDSALSAMTGGIRAHLGPAWIPAGQADTWEAGDSPAGQADTRAAGESGGGQAASGPLDAGQQGTDTAAGPDASQEESGEESEYADLAIANVSSRVRVRSGPDTASAIVGVVDSGAVAQVLEIVPGEDGEWFRVVSGNVEGYTKAEFFLYGESAAEVIDDYVTRYAVVLARVLNVREEPDVETRRIGFIGEGEKVRVLENLGDWLKVQYTEGRTGYVAAEYVTVKEEFSYARTMEELAAEQAARQALAERQNISEAQEAENTEITVTPPSGNYSDNGELRGEIVAYAMQFLGNRYVHGGQSLETGTDCSGFTSLIYAQFGYSVSRTPSGQLSGAGRDVPYSEAQPGDIICYGSRRCTHVALYIGDGQIIHAANSRKGVVTQRADYDNILGVKNLID